MGYAQFIQLELYNRSKTRTYTIKGAWLGWGKFYENPNKDVEVSPDNVNGQTIKPQTSTVVAACGRSDASSGTEGSVEIWEGSQKVGRVYWNNPWLSGQPNLVTAIAEGGNAAEYALELGPYDNKNAAIGWVKVSISKVD